MKVTKHRDVLVVTEARGLRFALGRFATWLLFQARLPVDYPPVGPHPLRIELRHPPYHSGPTIKFPSSNPEEAEV